MDDYYLEFLRCYRYEFLAAVMVCCNIGYYGVRMFKIILCIISVLILGSCAASGPKFQEHGLSKPENALVYIYRPTKTVNCCVAPKVYINKSPKADLKNGGYQVYELPAGQYEIVVGDGSYGFTPEIVNLSLKSGEEIYLKWVIGDLSQLDILAIGNLAVGSSARDYYLLQYPNEKANMEIKELKLSQ